MLDTKTPTAALFRLGRKPDPWSPPDWSRAQPDGTSVIASTIRKATIAFSTLPLSGSAVLLRRLRDFDLTFP
jgi:hypothetical protein